MQSLGHLVWWISLKGFLCHENGKRKEELGGRTLIEGL